MIEQTLEGKIIAQIEALITDVQIRGYWQPNDSATNVTNQFEPPVIMVTVSPRKIEPTIPLMESACNIEILSTIGTDPRGVAKNTWFGLIIEMLTTLNLAGAAVWGSDTWSEAGEYDLTGIEIEQGDTGFDTDSNTWFVNIPVQFSYCPC